MELEILFEACDFHRIGNLVTKGMFTHVKRKCNVVWDWILHADDIVLSAKPPFCEVKIRMIRGIEQFSLQEPALGL